MPHAHDNAGQIRILFFPAAAAMKFHFLNKPVRLLLSRTGVPNILPPVVAFCGGTSTTLLMFRRLLSLVKQAIKRDVAFIPEDDILIAQYVS